MNSKRIQKWKEGTTTSPSGRHLEHHHVFLVPDGVQHDDSNPNFADTMWDIHNNITNITLLPTKVRSSPNILTNLFIASSNDSWRC